MTTRTDKEILQDIKDGKLEYKDLEYGLMIFMDFMKFDAKTGKYVFTKKALRLLK